jgi:hypothetical protein
MTKKTMIKSSIIAIVICAAAFIGYILIKGWHEKGLERVKIQQEKAWKGKFDRLSDKVISLEKETADLKGLNEFEGQPEDTKEDKSFASSAVKTGESTPSIDEIERRIAAFFMYLDEQDYVKNYNLNGSAYNEYEISIQEISSKIPVIAGETDTLYNLLLNMAHFYRVLGKKRLFLIRDVLNNEDEKMESMMNTFFLWYTYKYDKEKKIKGRPTIEVLYEYTSFFLNTIGGRSYLLRRNSKLRLLTTYYCVLILDRANDVKLNSHGIDIRPHLEMLSNEMTEYIGLKHQRDYLNKLKELMNKYKR